jgi:Uma2 family endonuclease
MRVPKTLFTAEELFHLPTNDRRLELVGGLLFEMSLNGAIHVGAFLRFHAKANGLGEVLAAGTGFILRRNPDTVRAPDAAFVAAARLPVGELPAGFMELAPDLAVEVVSPSDRPGEVAEKVADWLRAGTRLVWVIDPATRSAKVYRSLDDVQGLSEEDRLDGGAVVPGFSCALRELFA